MRTRSQGGASERALVELIRCQGLYTCWRNYDKAPEVAQQIFADLPQDPKAINNRFISLLRSRKSSFTMRELAAANFYGIIGAYLNRGIHDKAKNIIQKIIQNEKPMEELSNYLRPLDISFVDLCIERGQLLVPKVLDSVVLQLFGPKSQGDYLDKPGVAIIYPSSNDYQVTIIQDKCEGQKVVNQGKSEFNNLQFDIAPEKHFIKGSEASLKDRISKLMDSSPDGYCIIWCEHKGLDFYISHRYITYRVGKMVTDLTPLRFKFVPSAERI